jgi:hypothetical protein
MIIISVNTLDGYEKNLGSFKSCLLVMHVCVGGGGHKCFWFLRSTVFRLCWFCGSREGGGVRIFTTGSSVL